MSGADDGEARAAGACPFRPSFPLFRAARVAAAAEKEARARRDTLRRESVETLVGLFDEFTTTAMAARQQAAASPSSPSSLGSADGGSPTATGGPDDGRGAGMQGSGTGNRYFSFDRLDAGPASAALLSSSPFTPQRPRDAAPGADAGGGGDAPSSSGRAGSPNGGQVLYEDTAALVVGLCGDNAGAGAGRGEAYLGVTVNEELHNTFHVFVLRPPGPEGDDGVTLSTTKRHRSGRTAEGPPAAQGSTR